ncbi:unnamed protein product [Schistosoma mattheei]|uniref:Uncharacterized protein n=1 Tax=Schistosoma mattheei TaxID=31246 RepID=A0AA85AWN3_9TREM|nr:unnamed protein product [Schistosoma mattheei]
MRTLSPVSTRIQHRQVALPRELSTCSHVFVRVDSVRKPLQQPYEGPFHVIARHEKTFKVDRHGRVEIVSIDRLKPAHVDDSALSGNLRFNARPIKPTSGILKSSSGPTLDISETSFSRPSQQHASSAPSTDETTVSRPDQQTTPPLAHATRTRLPSHVPVAEYGYPYASATSRTLNNRYGVGLFLCYTHATLFSFLIFFLFPEPTPSTISVWFRRLQSTLAKAGLITHALVNVLSRYIGFECLAYAWSRTWSLWSLLVHRLNVVSSYVCSVSGPDPTNAIFRFWIQTTLVACQLKQQIQHIAPGTVLRKRPSLATRRSTIAFLFANSSVLQSLVSRSVPRFKPLFIESVNPF